jgi:hypothetical protein
VGIWPLEGAHSSNPAISPAAPASGPDAPAASPAGPDVSPGARRLAGLIRRPAENPFRLSVRRPRRASPVCRRMVRPGNRRDRPGPLLAGDSTLFLFKHANPFTCELNLNAYNSNISSHTQHSHVIVNQKSRKGQMSFQSPPF